MGISSTIYLVNKKLTLEDIKNSYEGFPTYTRFGDTERDWDSLTNNKHALIFPSKINDTSTDYFIKYLKDLNKPDCSSLISEIDKDDGEAISILLNKEILMEIYGKWISKFMNPLVFLQEFDDMGLLNDFRILFSILEYGNIQIYYCW